MEKLFIKNLRKMDKYETIQILGILIGFISGLIMIGIILFGHPIYPINQNAFKSNPYFDFSVLGTFIGLIICSLGSILKNK